LGNLPKPLKSST